MTDLAIVNAMVVLDDQILDGGAVIVSEGRIAEVRDSSAFRCGALMDEFDAHGAYLIPGLVDLHNDGLEIEVRPRPHAELPLDLAFPTAERRLVGAGVTTEFHAISFLDQKKSNRTVNQAAQRARYIAQQQAAGGGAVQHHVLHRIDVWSPDYLDEVFASIDRLSVGYLSINDHTPGQGQFRDLEKYLELQYAYAATGGYAEPNLDEIQSLIADRSAETDELGQVYQRIATAARDKGIIIASHDDDAVEKVNLMYALGARIAEFPVTMEAARRARELGMAIVVGAPNIVRGGSQSGNLDAQAMFAAGLADIICADYHAPSLLPSAFRLVDDGVLDLPTAIRAVTGNPARALGMDDRGVIRPGTLADLNLVRRWPSGIPQVEATFRRGQPVYRFARVSAPVGAFVA
ncbi:MAG: alpha-D-ribose 1-methylphosphonate 5-triphosphate diphosphatase [Chloroflexota bacterium]